MKFGRVGLSLLSIAARFACTNAQDCIEQIDTIYEMESLVTDTSVHRTYVLCPRRIFEIGTLDFNYDLVGFRVHPPLPLRPNMHIKCGEDGARENLCWIAEGDVHMDATDFRGITDSTVDNVVIEGLVFFNAARYSLWATKPGHITFINCEFREFTKSVVPLLLDWYDGSDTELTVTIQDSYFHENRYFGRGSNTALIYANSKQNHLEIETTIFENNDMVHNNTLSDTNSFIIETLGPLTLNRVCFIDNIVGVSNAVVFANRFIDSDIFVSDSTGRKCGLAAVFANIQQFDTFTPICVEGLATSCNAEPVPTIAPSRSPTPAPSPSPTGAPTPLPTSSPAPTLFPSPSPSAAPSDPGTTAPPTTFPTVAPVTPVPTTAPIADVPPTPAPMSTPKPSTNQPTQAPGTNQPTPADETKQPTPAFVFPTTGPTGVDSPTDDGSSGWSLTIGYGIGLTVGFFTLL